MEYALSVENAIHVKVIMQAQRFDGKWKVKKSFREQIQGDFKLLEVNLLMYVCAGMTDSWEEHRLHMTVGG